MFPITTFSSIYIFVLIEYLVLCLENRYLLVQVIWDPESSCTSTIDINPATSSTTSPPTHLSVQASAITNAIRASILDLGGEYAAGLTGNMAGKAVLTGGRLPA